ncbi:helix-turn-helix transcriptional regulator [Filibacter tadaridae]|uniref:Transcriptional repressor DicA n=1 Tax=Filibacter tadaridae TaxID=2483811 RepID=A0A3P5X387_9BACL|nr:helix-turn-helix transcriptional regulator [Filibacter tadaridae]VDC24996.1 transcriptional repressor DicA [Filibacter tadaridae]
MITAQIKTKRKSLNMSQQNLADAAGIPKSTIGRIEAGITNPKVNPLLQISRVLDTPFIIDGTNDGNNSNLYVEL